MRSQHQFDRIERERRFILDKFPSEAEIHGVRRITDRYIEQTRLRLRHQIEIDGSNIFKLTQKIALPGVGAHQGFLTTIYLNREEFGVFAQLPAKEMKKSRFSIPPFGVDVFEDTLAGLILAEAEFESAWEADSLILPSFIVQEVSADVRFTGGRLACASRQDLFEWLSDYGIEFSAA